MLTDFHYYTNMWNVIVRKLAINHKDGKSAVENAGDHDIESRVGLPVAV